MNSRWTKNRWLIMAVTNLVLLVTGAWLIEINQDLITINRKLQAALSRCTSAPHEVVPQPQAVSFSRRDHVRK